MREVSTVNVSSPSGLSERGRNRKSRKTSQWKKEKSLKLTLQDTLHMSPLIS